MKKLLLRILYVFLLVVVVLGTIIAWPRLPILTGFAAKGMCSCVFVADRDPDLVKQQDLSFSPISLAKIKINYEEKSATASLLGLAKRKAVYREGLGAVVLVGKGDEPLADITFDIPKPLFDQDTVMWPTGNMVRDTMLPEVDYNRLIEVVGKAFDDPDATEYERKSHAMLVSYKDHMLLEKYAPGISADTRLIGWSMTKTIVNTMVGILIDQGKLSLKDPAPIPEWSGDKRSAITLEHLLHMADGLEWDENYFDLSDVTKLLYMNKDMYGYAIGRPALNEPGTEWNYSTGTTNILCGIVKNALDDPQDYLSFLYTHVCNPVGMHSMIAETDLAGTIVGSSYSFATTRDWARFGHLYLRKGIWEGDTIIAPDWIDYSIRPVEGSNGTYGAQLWLNNGEVFPDLPTDLIYPQGFLGQRVFIFPSHDLIVVRLGYSSSSLDFNKLLSDIMACIDS